MCGITSVDNQSWDYLRAILVELKIRLPNRYENKSFIEILTRDILYFFAYNFHLDRNEFSDSIQNSLEQVLLDQMVSDSVYSKNFDLFEILFALIYLEVRQDNWVFPHKAVDDNRSWQRIENFWEQGGRQGSQWGLINVGLFNDPDHMLSLLKDYREIAVRFHSSIPDFAAAYEHGLAQS